jgi:hypothetical protein
MASLKSCSIQPLAQYPGGTSAKTPMAGGGSKPLPLIDLSKKTAIWERSTWESGQ